ncbi:hypothetical protein GRI34_05945 [Erythrobacter aquimaris]|uniref:Uncharacterized protein n=1 Tax=Qipengyuania aquimaris TaxID=255984 RepID=A0A6I4TJ60_9SPHN|nr:hypothetical protein [Qipengyuania aquimaris]MXO95965.1 hypothetical protein [Qipengyuania aquimaris]
MSEGKGDRTWMFVSIVATAALTGLVTFLVQSYLDTKGRVDDRKLQEVSSVIESGQSYQSLSADFMREFTKNDTYDIEREKLRQNVVHNMRW